MIEAQGVFKVVIKQNLCSTLRQYTKIFLKIQEVWLLLCITLSSLVRFPSATLDAFNLVLVAWPDTRNVLLWSNLCNTSQRIIRLVCLCLAHFFFFFPRHWDHVYLQVWISGECCVISLLNNPPFSVWKRTNSSLRIVSQALHEVILLGCWQLFWLGLCWYLFYLWIILAHKSILNMCVFVCWERILCNGVWVFHRQCHLRPTVWPSQALCGLAFSPLTCRGLDSQFSTSSSCLQFELYSECI